LGARVLEWNGLSHSTFPISIIVWHSDPRLNRIDKDTHTNKLQLLFWKPISKKTPKLSVLDLERWVTDQEVLPGCACVRTKCVVGLWEYSWGPRELPGVGGPDLGEAGRYTLRLFPIWHWKSYSFLSWL
jgi:hypothetical protein